MKLAHVRRLSQAVVLVVYATAFAGIFGWGFVVLKWLPRCSPLLAITERTAIRGFGVLFLPAALLVVLGLVWPRLFCGWLCPLGTLIDLADRAWGHGRSPKLKRRKPDSAGSVQADHGGGGDREKARGDGQASIGAAGHRLALVLLAGTVILSVAGMNLAGLLDPLSLLTRGLGALGLPAAQDVNRWMPSIAPEGQPWGSGLLAIQALPAIMLLAVLALTVFGSRVWCRHVCPLGALYGLLGRVALCGRSVSSHCVQCGACARNCRMRTLAPDGSAAAPSHCTSCRSCQAVCPAKAISFSRRRSGPPAPAQVGKSEKEKAKKRAFCFFPFSFFLSPSFPAFSPSRRSFIRALVIGGATLTLIPFLHRASADPAGGDTLPPNVTDADRFAAKCLRCGACVRVCPSKTLQLAGSSPSLLGLWLPRRDTSWPCYFPDCHECGRVCPAGAIPYNGARYNDQWEPSALDAPELGTPDAAQ